MKRKTVRKNRRLNLKLKKTILKKLKLRMKQRKVKKLQSNKILFKKSTKQRNRKKQI